jgi:cytochrome oxidase assembly protein ShyY1
LLDTAVKETGSFKAQDIRGVRLEKLGEKLARRMTYVFAAIVVLVAWQVFRDVRADRRFDAIEREQRAAAAERAELAKTIERYRP